MALAGRVAVVNAWQSVVDANLTTTSLCTRAAAPSMKRRRWGRTVNRPTAQGMPAWEVLWRRLAAEGA
jgi:NAD(P)-dependent dehydrogenase (short-subunit alcohol dehydrogenase family)